MYSSVLEIDLDKLISNVSEIKKLIGPRVSLAAVAKADAYGLGIPGIAPALMEGGADLIGVARYQEAKEIRETCGNREWDILIMGLCHDRELREAWKSGFTITLDSLHQARLLSGIVQKESVQDRASVHIKLDTGFNRLGLRIGDGHSSETFKEITSLPGLKVEGVFSHLALEGPEADKEQVRVFTTFLEELNSRGINTGIRHICDSIGLARYPEYRMDMVRAGAILYGMRPFRAPLIEEVPLRFPLSWSSRIIRINRLSEGEGVSYDYSWKAPAGGASVATVPVGYADGYSRSLSNRGEVLIRGKRCPVVGLICMDQMMVDVSRLAEGEIDDRVTLLGNDDAGESIDILELAQWAGTNRNEILAGIGRRVRRKYKRMNKTVAELNYLETPPFQRRYGNED